MTTRLLPGQTLVTCPRCHGHGSIAIRMPTERQRRRRHAGLKLTDLAKQLGVSQPYLSQFEHGTRRGSAKIRDAYAAMPLDGHAASAKKRR